MGLRGEFQNVSRGSVLKGFKYERKMVNVKIARPSHIQLAQYELRLTLKLKWNRSQQIQYNSITQHLVVQDLSIYHVGVSKNGGTHKWMVYRENPIQKWMMTRGTPILGNPHVDMSYIGMIWDCDLPGELCQPGQAHGR